MTVVSGIGTMNICIFANKRPGNNKLTSRQHALLEVCIAVARGSPRHSVHLAH